MNQQENQLLQDFLTQLTQAHLGARDPEVEAMINGAVARQPDAPYLLVQRAMLLERALQQAKAQLASLQERSGGASFLGGADAWNQVPSRGTANAPMQAQAGMAAPLPPAALPAAGPTTPLAAPAGGRWGGLLGNAAATAAGVAGGAFLFEGLEGLFGHHGGGGFGGGGFGGGAAGPEEVENVTVNNYASDDRADDSGADRDDGVFDDDSSWT